MANGFSQTTSSRLVAGAYQNEILYGIQMKSGPSLFIRGQRAIFWKNGDSTKTLVNNSTPGYAQLYNATLDNDPLFTSMVLQNQDSILYIADGRRGNLIKYIFHLDTLIHVAGGISVEGVVDGQGASARMTDMTDLTINKISGDMYFMDAQNIRKVSPGGQVITVAGSGTNNPDGGYQDGPGNLARFSFFRDANDPNSGISFNANYDTLFISESGNRKIRKLSIVENNVSTHFSFAELAGDKDSADSFAQARSLGDLLVDSSGNILLVDRNNKNSKIRKITREKVILPFSGRYDSDPSDPNVTYGTGTKAIFGTIWSMNWNLRQDTIFANSKWDMLQLTRRNAIVNFPVISNKLVGQDSLLITKAGLSIISNDLPNLTDQSFSVESNPTSGVFSLDASTRKMTFVGVGSVTITLQNKRNDSLNAFRQSRTFQVTTPTGIGTLEQPDHRISILPNPVKSGAQVRFSGIYPKDQTIQVTLRNLEGKTLDVKFLSETESYSLPPVSSGLYIIQLQNQDDKFIRKLLVH